MYKFIVLLIALFIGTAHAQQTSIQVGADTFGGSIIYNTRMYENGDLTVVPEVGAMRWREHGTDGYQLYVTPTVRYQLSSSWYITGGVGLSYFNRTWFGDKNISTRFQFIDRIGIMYHMRDVDVGVQYVHASNAGIKHPNPGMDTVQFVMSVPFKR